MSKMSDKEVQELEKEQKRKRKALEMLIDNPSDENDTGFDANFKPDTTDSRVEKII